MEFLGSMASLLVSGLFIVTFNLQAFEIPSRSMENALLIGDHLFVDRTTAAPPTSLVRPLVPYLDVKRGDIIVFISPVEPGLHVVKRVMGVPGDRIRLKGGVVYRNGERLEEPYMFPLRDYNPYRDDFPSVSAEFSGNVNPTWALTMPRHVENGELVVPPGRYFAMGDHRDLSLDSRFWGFIPRENIIGRPMFIYWSFETPEDQYRRSSVPERIGWLFKVAIRFIPDTRWSRTLKLVH